MFDTLLCCGSCYNHVTMVNNVFPSQPGEEGPKPASLSLLVNYAQTKPHKLTKIGVYLEKRLAKDKRRGKTGYIKVTLAILNKLLAECHTHLNLISKYTLRIVMEILDYPDTELMLDATSTFVIFSEYYQHEITDPEFVRLYVELVGKFCDNCECNSTDSLLNHKTRISGLKAIQSIGSNDNFLKDASVEQLVKRMIPSSLHNLTYTQSNRDPPKATMNTAMMSHSRASVIDHLFNDDELHQVASSFLKEVFRRTNVNNIKLLSDTVFGFFSENKAWKASENVIRAFEIITSAVPDQYRHVLMKRILELLNHEVAGEDAARSTLVQTLTLLIAAGGSSAGLSPMELLEALVRHLMHTVTVGHGDSVTETRSQQRLIEAIAAMSKNIAYPEQPNEILVYLINRLAIDPAAPTTTTPDDQQNCTRLVLFKTMNCFLVERIEMLTKRDSPSGGLGQTRRQSFIRSPFDMNLLVPLLKFYYDNRSDVRHGFHKFMYSLMTLEGIESGSVYSPIADRFCITLFRTLYDYAQNPSNLPADYVAIGLSFSKSLTRYYGEALLGVTPVLFKLQVRTFGQGRVDTYASALEIPVAGTMEAPWVSKSACPALSKHRELTGRGHDVGCLLIPCSSRFIQALLQQGAIEFPRQQRGLNNVIIGVFLQAASIFKNASLGAYVEQVQHELSTHQWAPSIEISFEAYESLLGKTFDDTEGLSSDYLQPVSVFLSRERVIDILSSEPQLSMVSDLRVQLAIEYNPEEVEQALAAGASRKRQKSLGRLAPATTFLNPVPGTSPTPGKGTSHKSSTKVESSPIKLEELKEALAGPSNIVVTNPAAEARDSVSPASDLATRVGITSSVSAGSGSLSRAVADPIKDVKNILGSIKLSTADKSSVRSESPSPNFSSVKGTKLSASASTTALHAKSPSILPQRAIQPQVIGEAQNGSDETVDGVPNRRVDSDGSLADGRASASSPLALALPAIRLNKTPSSNSMSSLRAKQPQTQL
ncbi:uncharacterized protein BJ171DRAFT_568976 [Polychytrium aggregatum]|uniref:uncharacterized protein n=1 Tax=Polychytrium aggregatum TaxID=110093 RepID=UPI0022FEA44C|nr:uncharacterized protein BJ171DRAFT_568976 [Polychytrium aggregatum]KAI9203254.1 hypothetical protein BJ171DRAFT_568976 [Polychytrium aggregatum]